MYKVLPPLSIVVPALNEADNLPLLVQRVAEPLVKAGIDYEIVLVDDRSTDNTAAVIKKLSSTYPVRMIEKVGKRGKAYSLLQGFDIARYDLICMIDADLQYPPEAIVPMYRKLLANDADVVVTNRIEQKTSFLRKLSTKVFHFLMARMLFGIDYDTQSGLKLFKKSVLEGMDLKPSAWSFDLEFLIRSLEKHSTILSYAIPFGERHSGEAKVRLLNTTYELTSASLKLWFNSSNRKIRRGYRASMELSRRPAAMAALFAAGILSSLVIASGSGAAQVHAAPVLTSETTTSSSEQVARTDSAQSTTGTNASSQSGNDYYASQSLSPNRTNQLLDVAKVAAYIGAAITLISLVAWALSSLYTSTKRKSSRKLHRV